MNIKRMKLSEIRPAEYNPRVTLTGKDSQYKALKASIDEFGLVVPLVVNTRTDTLVSGHQRLNVMLAKGMTETDVVLIDLPVEKEKALCIALNKIEGEWNYGVLADILEEFQNAGEDLTATGFTDIEVKDLLEEIKNSIGDYDNAGGYKPEKEDVKCVVGEYRFTIGVSQFKDIMADVREKVGFAKAAVGAEFKRRLLSCG